MIHSTWRLSFNLAAKLQYVPLIVPNFRLPISAVPALLILIIYQIPTAHQQQLSPGFHRTDGYQQQPQQQQQQHQLQQLLQLRRQSRRHYRSRSHSRGRNQRTVDAAAINCRTISCLFCHTPRVQIQCDHHCETKCNVSARTIVSTDGRETTNRRRNRRILPSRTRTRTYHKATDTTILPQYLASYFNNLPIPPASQLRRTTVPSSNGIKRTTTTERPKLLTYKPKVPFNDNSTSLLLLHEDEELTRYSIPLPVEEQQCPKQPGWQPCIPKPEANSRFKECCRGKRLKRPCRRMCHYDLSKHELEAVFIQKRCGGSRLREVFKCAANQRNVEPCCQAKGVFAHGNEHCRAFCNPRRGIAKENRSTKKLVSCMKHITSITHCLYAAQPKLAKLVVAKKRTKF